jgi:hypothetical protein
MEGFIDFAAYPSLINDLSLKRGSFDTLPSASLSKKLKMIDASLEEVALFSKSSSNKSRIDDGLLYALTSYPSLSPVISPFSATSYDICLTSYKTISNLSNVCDIIKRNNIFSISFRHIMDRIFQKEELLYLKQKKFDYINRSEKGVYFQKELIIGNNLDEISKAAFFIFDHYHRLLFSYEVFFCVKFYLFVFFLGGFIASSISVFSKHCGRVREFIR